MYYLNVKNEENKSSMRFDNFFLAYIRLKKGTVVIWLKQSHSQFEIQLEMDEIGPQNFPHRHVVKLVLEALKQL